MKTVCAQNKCTGCMACIDVCPKQAIVVKDNITEYNAIINEELCVGCGMCHKKCQINTPVLKRKPQVWYQGWASNEETRLNSTSGGFASEIVSTFLTSGGVVFSCVFENGQFIYKMFSPSDNLSTIAGSKYVKSNPSGVYKKIKVNLTKGNKVLFIGLPCHVAALCNYLDDFSKFNLYTIDLICHGTPSPKLLKLFLEQYEIDLENIKQIRFRKSNKYHIEQASQQLNKFSSVGMKDVLDSYMIGFLEGLFNTDNCYQCQYATRERVSDLTLGDSWGSLLPVEERKKGISLALCQSTKGEELLKNASLVLKDVDLDIAIKNNHQLSEPLRKPPKRDKFFEGIEKGYSFNLMIWKIYPKKIFKQIIKKILIYSHIMKKL